MQALGDPEAAVVAAAVGFLTAATAAGLLQGRRLLGAVPMAVPRLLRHPATRCAASFDRRRFPPPSPVPPILQFSISVRMRVDAYDILDVVMAQVVTINMTGGQE